MKHQILDPPIFFNIIECLWKFHNFNASFRNCSNFLINMFWHRLTQVAELTLCRKSSTIVGNMLCLFSASVVVALLFQFFSLSGVSLSYMGVLQYFKLFFDSFNFFLIFLTKLFSSPFLIKRWTTSNDTLHSSNCSLTKFLFFWILSCPLVSCLLSFSFAIWIEEFELSDSAIF